MLDLSRPLEFDNGMPCVLVTEDQGYPQHPKYFRVIVPCYPVRGSDSLPHGNSYEYRKSDGVFNGGDAHSFYVVRNSGPAEPEEYEGWFVE